MLHAILTRSTSKCLNSYNYIREFFITYGCRRLLVCEHYYHLVSTVNADLGQMDAANWDEGKWTREKWARKLCYTSHNAF